MQRSVRNVLMAAVLVVGAAVPLVLVVEATHEAACDRSCLLNLTDNYVSAMLTRNPPAVNVAPGFGATENGSAVPLGGGVWKTVKSLTPSDRFADESSHQAGLFGVVTDVQGRTWQIALRLKTAGRRIQQVETLISRGGA